MFIHHKRTMTMRLIPAVDCSIACAQIPLQMPFCSMLGVTASWLDMLCLFFLICLRWDQGECCLVACESPVRYSRQGLFNFTDLRLWVQYIAGNFVLICVYFCCVGLEAASLLSFPLHGVFSIVIAVKSQLSSTRDKAISARSHAADVDADRISRTLISHTLGLSPSAAPRIVP